METTDKQFFLTFLGVTAALVGIAIVILIAANWVGDATIEEDRVSQAQVEIIQERIEPVGELRFAGDAQEPAAATPEADTTAAATPSEPKSGQDVYNGICQSCHTTGVAGAPIVGDIQAWKERIALGKEVLYSSVINGKGAMPPKGGDPSLSESQIQAAVDYMIGASQ